MVEGKKANLITGRFANRSRRRSPLRTVVAIAAGAAAALLLLAALAVWYARPEKELDLAYEEVAFLPKVTEMVKQRKLALTLTGHEIDQLIKKAVAERSAPDSPAVVTGIDSTLNDGVLVSDVNVRIRGGLSVGATVAYRLRWETGMLVAELEDAHVRKLPIPRSWIEPQRVEIPLDRLLPEFVGVKSIEMTGSAMTVHLEVALPRL